MYISTRGSPIEGLRKFAVSQDRFVYKLADNKFTMYYKGKLQSIDDARATQINEFIGYIRLEYYI